MQIKAKSWDEVCAFLQANVRNYSNLRRKIAEDVPYCYFLLDGQPMEDEDELRSKFPKASKIEVIPAVVQAGPAALPFIAKFLIQVAISFAISYVITKLMTPKDPKQVKTSSYVISGKTNIAARNTPVPIGYGRLRVAPPVINIMEINRDLFALDDDPSDSAAAKNDVSNRRCQGKQWQSCTDRDYFSDFYTNNPNI